MPAVPQPIEGSAFSINEYVWDHVWGGPAIVVGSLEEAGRLAVAEIVLPARRLGRVAHRRSDQISRYVRLLVPEEEAKRVNSVLRWALDQYPDQEPLMTNFTERLQALCDARGIEL